MFVLHAVGADHRHRAVQPAARKVTLADDAEVRHGGLDILAQRGGHFAAARFDQGAGRFVVRKNFQQRAQTLAQAWSKSGYNLVSLNLNTNNYFPQPVFARVSMAKFADAEAVPVQDVASGESKITVSASGTIQFK